MLLAGPSAGADEPTAYIRVNQVGYLAEEAKIEIAFAEQPIEGEFEWYRRRHSPTRQVARVRSASSGASNQPSLSGTVRPIHAPPWGKFPHYVELDFSDCTTPGRYYLQLADGTKSREFRIGNEAYQTYHDDLLLFMRQQRCGYNPLLDMICHQRDGRNFYGPLPDESFVDASGGWHDAGDQLKYLITASNATARMMLAYELETRKFGDRVDEMGRPHPTESRTCSTRPSGASIGYTSSIRMLSTSFTRSRTTAITRFESIRTTTIRYGWGPNSYRAVYFADGKPQGSPSHEEQIHRRRQYRRSLGRGDGDGLANLANELKSVDFAEKCLKAAKELYQSASGRKASSRATHSAHLTVITRTPGPTTWSTPPPNSIKRRARRRI